MLRYTFLTSLCLLLGLLLRAQDSLDVAFSESEGEVGRNLVVDDDGSLYLLTDVTEVRNVRTLLRKISPEGEEIFRRSFVTEATYNSRAKDLILTSDGNLLCLYLRDTSYNGPLTNFTMDLFYHLVSAEGGEDIMVDSLEIAPGFRDRDPSLVEQLTDGSFVLLSPRLDSLPDGGGPNVLSHLSNDLTLLRTVELPSILGNRARCLKVAEGDKVLVGSSGREGARIEKIDLINGVTLWRDSLIVPGTDYNIPYEPIILPEEAGYGYIANYRNAVDSLTGVYYFETDLEGQLRRQTFYRDSFWSPAAWPSVLFDNCGRVNLLYFTFDNDSTSLGYTRHLLLSSDGAVSRDTSYQTPRFRGQFRQYAFRGTNGFVGIGTLYPPNANATAQLVDIPFFSKLVATDNPFTEENDLRILVYPNPAVETVRIATEVSRASPMGFELFDLVGRRVHAGTLLATQEDVSIEVAHLPRGEYFLKLDVKKHTVVRTLILR